MPTQPTEPVDEAEVVPDPQPAPSPDPDPGPEASDGDKGRKAKDFEDATRDFFERLRIEIDPDKIDESLRQLGEKARTLVDQGRYTKVRLSYKGKPLGPDIPMGLLVAGEVASFWWAGPMRVLLLNLGVKSFVDVELVHEADGLVRKGVERFNEGEAEEAERLYREALRIKPGDTAALYNLGVLLRISGRKEQAVEAFTKAAENSEHPDGARAREALGRMKK